MNKRRAPGVRWVRPVLVTLLAVLMLVNVCVPGIYASAETVEKDYQYYYNAVTELETAAETDLTAEQASTYKAQADTLKTEIEAAAAATILDSTAAAALQTRLDAVITAMDKLSVSQVSVEEETGTDGAADGGENADGEEAGNQTPAPGSDAGETDSAAEQTHFEKLMVATTCGEMLTLMTADTDACLELTADQLTQLEEKVNAMEDDGYKEDVLDSIATLEDEVGDVALYAGGGNQGGNNQGGNNQGSTATSGNFAHIEIEVAADATVSIDGVTYTEALTITTSDKFAISATQNGQAVSFTYEGTDTGNGSVNGATVELTGSYPSGTKDNPVYYTVSVTRDVTFYLRDDDGNMLDEDGNITTDATKAVVIATLPITLTVTVNYWMADNYCPGICSGSSSSGYTWNTNWLDGKFVNGSGIDYPIHGDGGNLILTKGKLMITKSVVNNSNDATEFTFYVQNSAGKYVVFENGAYKELSDTLTDSCYVTVAAGSGVTLTDFPVGGYKVTEVQQDGYIIANVNGSDTSTNYSTDFIEVTKDNTSIPVAAFKNKVLTSDAGISIAKTANGLNSGTYPDPTVSIYAVNESGNKTGDALWTGTLTANGDRLYLSVTLPAGTYIIEETGHTVEGYDCTTTISGDATVDGMKFTVTAGNRYDLTVTNVYTEKPQTTTVTVKKTVTGNMGDYGKDFSFTASFSSAETITGVTWTKTDNADNGTAGTVSESSHTFTLKHNEKIVFANVPIGATLTVTETADGYTVTAAPDTATDGNDDANTVSITVPETGDTITFTNHKEANVETGVDLNSFPFYVLISTAVVFAGILLVDKARYGKKF